MIQQVNPLLALLTFIIAGLLGLDLLRDPDKWTRRVGRFYFRLRTASPWQADATPTYFHELARRAIDAPGTIPYYKVVWRYMGIVLLLFSTCSLLAVVSSVIQVMR